MKKFAQKFLIYSMGYFYLVAGVNHFNTPDFYLSLIPPFFSHPELINFISGAAEILLGLGVLYLPTRKLAAWGIFCLLICFIPSHVYFIQIGSCIDGGLCAPEWVGWVRLLIIHPMFLFWAFWVSKNPVLPKG
ncbi:MAG: hypothetical protein NBV61_07330 [Algoriphagus sp.]|nr:hypothetical protein [Algoriphagus sp.]